MRTLSGPTDHVVVVGAGLSGLSAALHLLGAGRQVTVVERGPVPGGRAGRAELRGYTLDTGPTVLTMPGLVDEALAAVGERLADRVDLMDLHPAYHARFADGSRLDVHTRPDAMEDAVHRLAGPAEAAGYRRLRRWLEDLYRVQMRTFIDANFDSPLGLLTADLARLAALGGFRGWDGRIARFLSDERLRRVFSFQALYAGVAPARALAAYAVIAYMDTVAGVHFPRGGMHAVPRAMAEAARRAGAVFHYDTEVTALERSPGGSRVTAVRAGDRRIGCDALVLSCELPTARRLLGRAPRRPLPLRYAPSAVVLHAGTRRGWDLGHHTLSFGAAWGRTFRELTRAGHLMSDPSLLITSPTASDPALAPDGRHLHYVLAPCPNLHTGPRDWRALAPRYRDHLVAELERRGLDGFGAAVESEHLVTPADWADQGHAAGTPFSVAHTFAQTGPFRPRNLPPGCDNVVLAGCGTTPGVGVPTVIISGKLAAARVTGIHLRPAPRPAPHAAATGTAGAAGTARAVGAVGAVGTTGTTGTTGTVRTSGTAGTQGARP
ncbi:phytoene desaturase family protein [Streptomyces sp. Ru87]|uniref:phytoene desaturase family protein n=1 Tax=Streptomyces sp. Ru87 TaxID=2044307 RepID=UPI000BF6842A|nr:phytoene desaturase family protein [Streptomyces sp. Ru87]PGH52237.1 phytoene dehydrogenase [Streptomyces sp. Ru87]